MERLRLWIQTLALLMIGVAGLTLALRETREAHAAKPAVCQVVPSAGTSLENLNEEIVSQSTEMLNAWGDREHVAVMPFGRMAKGDGKIYSVVCAW